MEHPPEVRAVVEHIATLKRRLRAVATAAYGDLGLGDTQMKFLRYVAQNPRVSQAELARATETDPALTGRALQGMISRGVLRRERSKQDARVYLLDLGPKGPALLKRVQSASVGLVQTIVAPLDARDLADFDRIARKLLAALDGKTNSLRRDVEPTHVSAATRSRRR